MKSNLRRIFCLLLAITMIFSVAACGKTDNSGSTLDFDDEGWDIQVDANTDANNESKDQGSTSVVSNGNSGSVAPTKNADTLSLSELTAQIPSKLRGTTINVFSWNPIKDVTGAEKVIADFEKKTGIKVKWEQGSYDKYDEAIIAKINSGAAPDVIRYNEPNPGRMSTTQDLKTATGFDFKGEIWDDKVAEAFTVNGKTYGINLKNTFNKQPTVVMYLKSTIENQQLEDPYQLWKQGKWTFDKFLDMCREFKEKTNGSCGWMTSRIVDIMWFRGLSFISRDKNTGKYSNNSTNPEIINMLKDVCTWTSSDLMAGGMAESASFCSGNYLFYTDSIIGARRNDFHFVDQKKNNDLFCVPFPQENGKTFYQSNSESEAYGIPKGAKNPEAVYYYLRYYLDASNYDSKMFFSNNQILEVYNWCIAQPNQHFTFDRKLTKAYAEELLDIPALVREGLQPAQVQTKLESLSPKFKLCADKANEVVAKF